jgi:hypothetical protein
MLRKRASFANAMLARCLVAPGFGCNPPAIGQARDQGHGALPPNGHLAWTRSKGQSQAVGGAAFRSSMHIMAIERIQQVPSRDNDLHEVAASEFGRTEP